MGLAQVCPTAPCSVPANCNDGKFCTQDFCVGTTCVCVHSDGQCDDGNFCDGANYCNAATDVCEEEPPVQCDPPLFCSTVFAACVECETNAQCTSFPRLRCNSSGTCVECTSASHCQDGAFCTGFESCNTTTGSCENGTPVSCPKKCFLGSFPGITCSTDANCGAVGNCVGMCSDQRAACVECENAAHCSNGIFCDGPETCVNDVCVAGTAPVCKTCVGGNDDGAGCAITADCASPGTCTGGSGFCDEANDRCQVCLNNSHCNDGLMCTTDECTLFPVSGLRICNNASDDSICDNGAACDGAEHCNVTNTACEDGTSITCQKKCFLGTVPGTNCTSDANCGSGGKCLGFCSETFGGCAQCENSATCNDGQHCNGVETCGGNGQCVNGTTVDCSAFDNLPCGIGQCNENINQCQTQAINSGQACEDANHCTASSKCSGGVCANNPPASNDPYRCIRLEWRPTTSQAIPVGSTAILSLYAVANGCNTPSEDCPTGQASVAGVEALVAWNPTYLEIQTSTTQNRNPQDPCDHPNPCYVCNGKCSGGSRNGLVCDNVATLCPGGLCNSNPATFNWSSSLFPNDCISSQMNGPCPSSGFPGNDGTLYYQSIQPITCSGSPPVLARSACATTAGLHITDIKFKAKAVPPTGGGVTTVSFTSCGPIPRRTAVIWGDDPIPGTDTDDILKTTGPEATIVVLACGVSADCNDNEPCTVDSCLNGTCSHSPMSCQDADLCTDNACVNGVCVSTPYPCDPGDVCFQGVCYDPCSTTAECNDGVDCTVDTCDTSPPAPIDGICRYTPDDGFCDTGLFCSARRCDPVLDCVFDHHCFSGTGNPCPNPAQCDENTDTCGGCYPPIVSASGARYLDVSVNPLQGSTPLAIRVIGDCDDPETSCVARYVQSKCSGGANNGLNCFTDVDCPRRCSGGSNNGNPCSTDSQCPFGTCTGHCDGGPLDAAPAFKTAAQWATAKVRGAQIRPSKKIVVQAECNFGGGGTVRSAAAYAWTWKWGNVDGDLDVDAIDILLIVNKFKNLPGATAFEPVNLWGCTPDGVIDAFDIVSGVDAFKGVVYPCGLVCP